MDFLIDNSHAQAGFDKAIPPVLSIAPGGEETVGFQTSDLVYAQLHEHGSLAKVTATINPVTGPVYVEGAMPGDTLAVKIEAIELADYGWSVYLPGTGAL